MAQLSLTRAWNETAEFVKREARLLVPIAFLLAVLPGAVLGLIAPQPTPGRPLEPGAWLLFLPIVLLLAMIANVALSRLVLRPGTSVGEALNHGVRRLPAVLGAALILMAGAFLVLIVIAIVVSAIVGVGATPSPQAIGATMLVAAPIFLFFAVRLMLSTPVAAAEAGGPIAILRRSWRLTGPHFWQLLGLLLLVTVLVLVVALVVQLVGGSLIVLIAGTPQPGSLSAILLLLLSAIMNTVVTVYLATLIARVYAQLAPAEGGSPAA